MTVLALKTDSIPWILFFHEWFIWLLGSQLVPWRPLVYRVHPHLHAWSLLWLCSLLLVWIGLYVLVCLLPDSWCSLEVLGAVCSLLSRLVVSLPKESLVYYSSFHLSEILTCGLSSFKQVPQFPRIRTQFPFSIFWLSGLGCFLAVDFRRTVKRDSSFDTHPFFWHTFRTTMVVKNVLYIYGEILHPCRAFRIVNILFERTNF